MDEKDCRCEALEKEVERLREGLRALQEGKVDVVLSDEKEISFVVPQSRIEQQNRELELLFDNMMNGFAYHEIITDENDLPIDYLFLRANPAFKRTIGLSDKDVVGKKATEVLPGSDEIKADWIKTFGKVALNGSPIQFEQYYPEPVSKWYLVSVYSPQTRYFAIVIKEITGRKESEQALRKSERSLAKAQKIAQLGNWDWDLSTNVLTWSDEIYRIFGLSKGYEVSYDAFISCIHPDERGLVKDAVAKVLRDGNPYSIDHRIVRPDGEERFVHEQAEVIRKNGEPINMIGTVQDVTEQKRAEFELRKFSLAVEQSPVVVVITDLKGNIEYVNSKFVEITGYSYEEAVGQNPRILKSGRTPPEVYKDLWEKIKSGREWQGEFENKRKNGELFWENALISPVKNPTGVVTQYIALKEDITERKRAEEELKALRIQFERTIDALSTEVCLLNDKGEILYINESWRDFAILDGQGQTFTGNYLDACEKAAKNKVPEARAMLAGIREILSGLTDSFSLQYTFHSPGETKKHWFVVTVTFFETGKEKYLVIAHKEVTNSVLREKAEGDRLVADKANQAKSEFLANMSHEIRTPLNGILGFSQTALRFAEREKLTTIKSVEYFQKIQNSGIHLAQLINDVLDLSKIEAGKINLQMTNVSLEYVVKDIWSNFEQKAAEKNLQIGTEIPYDLPMVRADRQKLSQVLINLISNAVKFTENGDVCVKAFVRNSDVIVSVCDTGLGIPEERIGDIFDKFSQVEGKLGEKNQGTGLGLAITQRLIRAMQGDIWVTSEVGKGSTFSFQLKVSQEE